MKSEDTEALNYYWKNLRLLRWLLGSSPTSMGVVTPSPTNSLTSSLNSYNSRHRRYHRHQMTQIEHSLTNSLPYDDHCEVCIFVRVYFTYLFQHRLNTCLMMTTAKFVSLSAFILLIYFHAHWTQFNQLSALWWPLWSLCLSLCLFCLFISMNTASPTLCLTNAKFVSFSMFILLIYFRAIERSLTNSLSDQCKVCVFCLCLLGGRLSGLRYGSCLFVRLSVCLVQVSDSKTKRCSKSELVRTSPRPKITNWCDKF